MITQTMGTAKIWSPRREGPVLRPVIVVNPFVIVEVGVEVLRADVGLKYLKLLQPIRKTLTLNLERHEIMRHQIRMIARLWMPCTSSW